jgi:hypothetical protein
VLAATLPADTPIGKIKLWVSNGEGASRPQEIGVADSRPAIFTLNGEGWGPALRDAAQLGSQITLAVNGLNGKGPKVFVAGKQADIQGVSPRGVTFTIPQDAPTGCWTPVWMESASGSPSNFATIRITDKDKACEEAPGWPLKATTPGTRSALVTLHRVEIDMELTPTFPVKLYYESGSAVLFRAGSGPNTRFQIPPPNGTCTAGTGTVSQADLAPVLSLRGLRGFLDPGSSPLGLGAAVKVFPDPAKEPIEKELTETSTGEYSATLGGSPLFPRSLPLPRFFLTGSYNAAIERTKQIEPFRVPVDIPARFEWIYGSPATEVDRRLGILVRWRNAAPGRQMALIAFSADQSTGAAGAAICLASPGDSQMRIPPYALANLPPTRSPASLPLRFLILVSMPVSSGVPTRPEGLDEIRAAFLDIQATSVTFR